MACRRPRRPGPGPAQRRHPAPHRVDPLDDRCGQRPPVDLLLGGRHRGGAVLRRDAIRPASGPSDPDNDRFVLSKGHAAPLLYAAWAEAGAFDRGRAAAAAADRLGPRGAPHAAPAVRGRGHRVARAGPVRRRRHGAQRAAHRVGLPHLRAARRRRVGRGLGVGGGRRRRAPRAVEPVRDHRRERARPEPRRPPSATTWMPTRRRLEAFGWHAIVVDGHDLAALLDAFDARAADHRPPDDDPGADDQGQGRLVHRGAERLARPAAQEGRGGARPRRAARAVRRRRAAAPTSPPPAIPGRRRRRARRNWRGAPSRPPPAYALGDARRDARGVRHRAREARRGRPARRRPRRATWGTPPSARSSRRCSRGRFYQNFIAEQVDGRRGHGAGQPRRDPVPVHLRLLPDARLRLHPDGGDQPASNVKLAGSHAGVSIGEDGPSQMALEDLAMMRAEPNIDRAVPVRRGQHRAAGGRDGVHARARPTSGRRGRRRRSSTGPDETFPIGGLQGAAEQRRRRGDGDRRRASRCSRR